MNERNDPDDNGDGHAVASDGVDSATGSRRAFLAGVGAAGLATALAGCPTAPTDEPAKPQGFDRVPPEDDRTEWGEPLSIGDGEVRTFVAVDDRGEKMVGAEFTPGILNPEPLPREHVLFSVPLPDTDAVPFAWLGLDWEPGGHYPGDKYAIPHYDFHFYFPPESTIADIPEIGLPPEEASVEELYTRPLPRDMVPPNYFRTNYTFPYMGEHLYNAAAPQYNGGTFGNTFVYGHWDGELIFMEPMITLPYFRQLKAGGDPELDQLEGVGRRDHRALDSPARFPEAGEYPTEYTVEYHEDRDVFTVTEHTFEQFGKTKGQAAGVVEFDRGPERRTETATPTEPPGTTVTVAPEGRLVFAPEAVEIAAGETVTWRWAGSYHNLVPVDQPAEASWEGDPEIRDAGHTHSYTFEVPGTYEYVCEPHRSQGMTGSITVTEG